MKTDLNSSIEWAVRYKLRCKRRPSFARHKAFCLVLLIALSFGTPLNAESSRKKAKSYSNLPVLYDLRPAFVLFSWMVRDGSHRFALIASRDGTQEHRFIDKFSPQHTKGIDIRALARELTKLPPRCVVEWMKDDPHKLDYADVSSRRKLRTIAARLQLDLQFNEMTYESTAMKR